VEEAVEAVRNGEDGTSGTPGGVWPKRALGLAGVDTSWDADGEAVFERTLWKALGDEPGGCEMRLRQRMRQHAAGGANSGSHCAPAGHDSPIPPFTHGTRIEASLRERPHDPEPCTTKSSPR
jgi:hypothetical protein